MKKSHDTIAIRLASILIKLNSGDRLTKKELMEEFNVSDKTIHRDLTERLIYLPICYEKPYYFLESYALGKLSFEDMKNFAAISGVKHLFPSLSNDFITDLLNVKINAVYLVKSLGHESITSKKGDFQSLSVAILHHTPIRCTYKEKSRELHPYKLVNQQGIWYLVAEEDGVLKNFSFTKIEKLTRVEGMTFEPKKELIETIQKNEATWFSQKSIEVTLRINASVSEYFLRRDVFPNQTIVDHSDDHLILSTKVSYDEEILRIVQYWLPHITIIEPTHLHDKLLQTMQGYLTKI